MLWFRNSMPPNDPSLNRKFYNLRADNYTEASGMDSTDMLWSHFCYNNDWKSYIIGQPGNEGT